jgi:serine/threonine protein kinase
MAIKCPKCNANIPETVKFCGECGTQLPSVDEVVVTKTIEKPEEELNIGSTFASGYQIIEELGKAGMGRVYKALDKKLHNDMNLELLRDYPPFKELIELKG